MPLQAFRIAEALKFDSVAGEPVFNEKSRREFPIITVASEAVDHKHHGAW